MDPNIRQPTLFDNPPLTTHCDASFMEAKLARALDAQGKPYMREYPIGRYRGDFVFLPQRLIVEVDGYEFHHTKQQREHDAKRDRTLTLAGWRVIRFTGSEVWQNVDHCVAVIVLALKTLPSVREERKAA